MEANRKSSPNFIAKDCRCVARQLTRFKHSCFGSFCGMARWRYDEEVLATAGKWADPVLEPGRLEARLLHG